MVMMTDTAYAPAGRACALPATRDLADIAWELEGCPPEDILRWALATYAPRITLACSFGGPSGMVLLDMVMRLDPTIPVFYLDTGLLFPETYALAEEAARRYGITPRAIRPTLTLTQQARRHGDALWAREPDRCCELRKVRPQRKALAGFDAWITGLRRDQSTTRRVTPVVQWDAKFGLAKICPLADWSERDVWRYLADRHIPYNSLHASGYPSIGCAPCTRSVLPGEDARAGRWSGFDKTECGLHTPVALPAGA